MVGLHRARRVPSRAGIDACVVRLGVVDDQLTDVSDHHVTPHMIRPHGYPLQPFRLLLLPGDVRPGATRHLTQEAGRVPHCYDLVDWAADQGGRHRFGGKWHGCLKRSSGRAESGYLGRAGVGPGEVKAAGDDGQDNALGARLCVHIALVVVGHAVGRAGEVRLPLAAVPALTHRLPVPDVTLGSLLGARETCTRGFLGYSHGGFIPVQETGSHAAPIPTHVLATLLKGLTLLGDEKKELLMQEAAGIWNAFPYSRDSSRYTAENE